MEITGKREREREREREGGRERDLTEHVRGLPRTVCSVTAIFGVALQLVDGQYPNECCPRTAGRSQIKISI